MKIIKIGDKYLNMDNVTNVNIGDIGVFVYFAVGVSKRSSGFAGNPPPIPERLLAHMVFAHDEATQLLQWLDSQVENK